MSSIKPETLKILSSDSLNKINRGSKRTHAFNVDFIEYHENFVGRFQVHYPSQFERLQMGVLKSNLLGGNLQVDVLTDNLAQIIATLDTVLDEKPDWFDIENPDLQYEIMEAVYLEYENWVDSFRRSVKKNADTGDSQDQRSKVPVVDTEDVSSTTN